MFCQLNDNFFLDEDDIGKLVCVKIHQKYSKNATIYDNCVVIDCVYKKSNIRPDRILFLKDSGSILVLNLNYKSKVEIKFLIENEKTSNNKNKFIEKYKKFYKTIKE